MPPRDPKPANSKRKSKPKLDAQEPALTKMLEQYCDLRRRGFGQQAIQTKASWPRHYPSLLLKEAQRRNMPGSEGSQSQAVTEWLLEMFDAGTELRVIQRTSAYTGQQTQKKLQTALDNASGPAPNGLIITDTHGEPARVSWLDTNGELMHRPFDGAFPAHYPEERAIRQCTEVLYRLISYPNNSARDRAYTMLSMAQAGLHSFDYDSGKLVNAGLEKAGPRRGREAHLHPEPPPSPERRKTPTPEVWHEFQVADRQRSQVPVPSHETVRILASLHPQRARTPGAQPRHLLHHRTRLPDTGTVRRRKRAVHPSIAANWVHHPEHRKRLVDVGRAAWRTPSAQTK